MLSAGDRQLDLSSPVCMGVLNITPDSFSDGSQFAQAGAPSFSVDLDRVLARAGEMVDEGASILDIGGESTRPGAEAVAVEQELERVIPVIEALRANFDICISVDTSAAQVMKEAINAGADLVNDIRALSEEGALEEVVSSTVGACLMHMQGQPRTMQQNFTYDNVVEEVYEFLAARVRDCVDAGVARDRILVDPGFGFGKSVQHNYKLLQNLRRFQDLGAPILVGLSRKSMLGAITDRPVTDRLPASVAAATLALQEGASIVRSHDVAATVDAIRVHCAYEDA